MLEPSIVEKLKERYDVHPLIFHRAAERARTPGELFDILEDLPEKFPFVWDEDAKRFVYTNDLTLSDKFDFIGDETC